MSPTKITRDKGGNMTYEKGIENPIPVKKKSVTTKPKEVVANKTFDITSSDALRVIAEAADKAANKIDSATEKAATLLANAADKATTALASAAKDASTLLASNASEAMKVSSCKNEGDHDLLIRLETKMTGLKEDIKDIKDGTSTKINDHETRIFALETSKTKHATLLTIGVAIIVLLVSIVLYHLFGINV